MTPVEPGENDLVTRAKTGDTDAFGTLADRTRSGLIRCAALLTGDPDEAESLAQEALTRAFVSLADYRSATPFFAWVRGITLNLCRQHLRRITRHARPTEPNQLAEAPDAVGRRNGVLSGILRDELSARVWLVLGQLPEAYREAVVLHYIEGLDYDQISEITGVSATALRVRALRGRALLRGELGSVVDTWLRTETDEDNSP
jgi:RNA polymerase sigma-70 factor (ECF subfamily)